MTGTNNGVDYFVAYYSSNMQGRELINSNNKLFNFNKWSVESKFDYGQFKMITITNISGHKRLLAYTYSTRWLTSASALEIKLSQAVEALSGQPQLGFFIALSLPIEKDNQDNQRFIDFATVKLADDLQDYLSE